jgi:acetyl esterase/lipase
MITYVNKFLFYCILKEKFDETLVKYKSSIHKPKSRFLILQVHGGGFISQSSRAHLVYLKSICKGLKTTIVSVDYSLGN